MKRNKDREDFETQDKAYRKLISAVIAIAVRDAQRTPIIRAFRKKREPGDLTISAMYFLFTDSSNGYLTLLDYDPQSFKKALVEKMFDLDHKVKYFDPVKRRNFRYNYKWFVENYKNLDVSKVFSDKVINSAKDEPDYED